MAAQFVVRGKSQKSTVLEKIRHFLPLMLERRHRLSTLSSLLFCVHTNDAKCAFVTFFLFSSVSPFFHGQRPTRITGIVPSNLSRDNTLASFFSSSHSFRFPSITFLYAHSYNNRDL
jgi:hypothetical protein